MRRYLVRLGVALGLYVMMLAVAITLIDRHWLVGRAADAVALMPLIGVAGAAWVIVAQVRVYDELQRRIQLEALAIAFTGTALVTLGYGFLETVGFPRQSAFWVWSIMGPLWGISVSIIARRYR